MANQLRSSIDSAVTDDEEVYTANLSDDVVTEIIVKLPLQVHRTVQVRVQGLVCHHLP